VKDDKNLFIDTSAFVALRVRDDANHRRAQQFLTVIKDGRLRLHTTNFILDEVYTYFCGFHTIAMEMAELITDNPLIVFHRIGAEDENRALEILRAFKDKDFSYTDATSFAAMDRLELNVAFAFDEHFVQYKKFLVVP
jgi:predicted nucleic acid-binding protein